MRFLSRIYGWTLGLALVGGIGYLAIGLIQAALSVFIGFLYPLILN